MNRSRVDRVCEVIVAALKDLNEDLELPQLQSPDRETRLFGEKSGLDSLALVSLIADVEERVAAEFGQSVILADERAMSQRTSPFRRVETLALYVEEQLKEQEQEQEQGSSPGSDSKSESDTASASSSST